MTVISLPTNAMGPFGMPMTPGDGSSGGGGGVNLSGRSIGGGVSKDSRRWIWVRHDLKMGKRHSSGWFPSWLQAGLILVFKAFYMTLNLPDAQTF